MGNRERLFIPSEGDGATSETVSGSTGVDDLMGGGTTATATARKSGRWLTSGPLRSRFERAWDSTDGEPGQGQGASPGSGRTPVAGTRSGRYEGRTALVDRPPPARARPAARARTVSRSG